MTVAAWLVAAVAVVGWWRARDENGRLRALTDPHRAMCVCGHDDVFHHDGDVPGCYGESRPCMCAATPADVQARADERRVFMTRDWPYGSQEQL